MSKCCSISIVAMIGLLALACNQPGPDTRQPAGVKTASGAKPCMDQVIALDDSLGKVRNHACKTISLSETIRQYAAGMEKANYASCPPAFVTAFNKHREAWLAVLPVADKYPDLRGEMHDLFKKLETGKDADTFKPLVKAIWGTWAEVEQAVKE